MKFIAIPVSTKMCPSVYSSITFSCNVFFFFFFFLIAQLLDTKSTDRKMTLLHYIALIVKEKYHELANFYNELHFVDKAAAGERAPVNTWLLQNSTQYT